MAKRVIPVGSDKRLAVLGQKAISTHQLALQFLRVSACDVMVRCRFSLIGAS
jgi:hypothetical protein